MEQNTGMIDKKILIKEKIGALFIAMLFLVVMIGVTGCSGNNNDVNADSAIPEQMESIEGQSEVNVPGDTPGAVGGVVDIDETNDKMVSVSMDSVGRANPFVHASDLASQAIVEKNDLPKFDILEPPMSSDKDVDASKIVTTKISGIMYDKYNPSAIINIEDTDYLVRSGDVINGYKVLAISPQTVTVQLGSNVYKAGVGEIVSKDGLTYNQVPNLSHKFGGAANNKK